MKVAFFIATTLFQMVNCDNRQELSILSLMQQPNGILQSQSCNAAIEIVLENVNKRNDILPGYKLTHVVKDEGGSARLANVAMVKYQWESEQQGRLMSPAIFGPSIACSFSGATVKALGFVSFSPQCHGQYIIDRKSYYSLYSVQAPGQQQVWPALAFIATVGKWKQIGIVTHRVNPNEYLIGEFMQKVAVPNGIEVLTFSNEYEITMDTVLELKKNDVRVVVVPIVQVPVCLRFLCLAHKAGLRPPNYVFIFILFNCLVADLHSIQIPQGCSIDILQEQMSIAFAAGGLPEPK